jgi:ankyrin repeat protein
MKFNFWIIGQTALHLAAKNGSIVLVTRLIESGADIEKETNDGKIAFYFRTMFNFWIIGKTPLNIAVLNSYLDIVTILIKSGAEINVTNKNGKIAFFIRTIFNFWIIGRTPIHFASNKDVAKALLDAGVDPNIQDNDGIYL